MRSLNPKAVERGVFGLVEVQGHTSHELSAVPDQLGLLMYRTFVLIYMSKKQLTRSYEKTLGQARGVRDSSARLRMDRPLLMVLRSYSSLSKPLWRIHVRWFSKHIGSSSCGRYLYQLAFPLSTVDTPEITCCTLHTPKGSM